MYWRVKDTAHGDANIDFIVYLVYCKTLFINLDVFELGQIYNTASPAWQVYVCHTDGCKQLRPQWSQQHWRGHWRWSFQLVD